MIVCERPITDIVDDERLGFRDSLELALRRIADKRVLTRWSDAALPGRTPADPLPSDPEWTGGRTLTDARGATSSASPHDLFATVQGIGGQRGWYVTGPLWALRGFADKLVGGVGMRRGRKDPDRMWVGDAVDFWRVEAVEPDQLIRLRAEMLMPGEAWLEWNITPGEDGHGSHLDQRAIFHPKGLAGRAYWYSLVPFHAIIFKYLALRLAKAAENRRPADEPQNEAA